VTRPPATCIGSLLQKSLPMTARAKSVQSGRVFGCREVWVLLEDDLSFGRTMHIRVVSLFDDESANQTASEYVSGVANASYKLLKFLSRASAENSGNPFDLQHLSGAAPGHH
jgi:hypothetical protein